jgi:hypothetical protein
MVAIHSVVVAVHAVMIAIHVVTIDHRALVLLVGGGLLVGRLADLGGGDAPGQEGQGQGAGEQMSHVESPK